MDVLAKATFEVQRKLPGQYSQRIYRCSTFLPSEVSVLEICVSCSYLAGWDRPQM